MKKFGKRKGFLKVVGTMSLVNYNSIRKMKSFRRTFNSFDRE